MWRNLRVGEMIHSNTLEIKEAENLRKTIAKDCRYCTCITPHFQPDRPEVRNSVLILTFVRDVFLLWLVFIFNLNGEWWKSKRKIPFYLLIQNDHFAVLSAVKNWLNGLPAAIKKLGTTIGGAVNTQAVNSSCQFSEHTMAVNQQQAATSPSRADLKPLTHFY